jgi:hypothetical protein
MRKEEDERKKFIAEEQRKLAATNETLQHLISRHVALAQPGVEKNSEPMDTRLCSAPC